MKPLPFLVVCAGTFLMCETGSAQLLINGNLDITSPVEIVPGFFLPKPDNWVNEGLRTISGPYEDEMSSEPWAGPAPTPATTDGNSNPPHPDGCGGADCGVFFKPFTGGGANGSATGHLYQDVSANPGWTYTLTGWAGAEANYQSAESIFALDFLNGAGGVITSFELNLVAAGLFTANGQPFNYKQYTVIGTAPAGAAMVRARASMIDAFANPAGGGQAFVVDDFVLTAVPEPGSAMLALLSLGGMLSFRSRKHRTP
jgi:hypothetical protein